MVTLKKYANFSGRKTKEVAINKKKKALLEDEVSIYRLEENTLDYVLFRIRELTGKLY